MIENFQFRNAKEEMLLKKILIIQKILTINREKIYSAFGTVAPACKRILPLKP